MKKAIIDLGTNTFHLMIFEGQNILFKTSIASKIGQGGINQNIITEDGIQRALAVLTTFKQKLIEFEVDFANVFAFGTSAIRNANNQEAFVERVRNETQITVTVIDGNKEAELIYTGVSNAVKIDKNALIVDIGGGSVEFILCNPEKILWKRSFEIGGQRLMEKFMKKDKISQTEMGRLEEYLRQELLPLTNAVHQYQPEVLIGSSGSFDTLNDMFFWKKTGDFAPTDIVGFDYPISEFWIAFEQLIFANHEERMKIGGMIPLRVDMIVVAVCLIKFVLQTYNINEIKISNYALKEGAFFNLAMF
ncbi:Ppx/GppA phosphatase family protein [Lacihabitans soyangensis]|uniref:Phosphatase n=1 Tax=Lacihabitans soyangensis TaxID=869394 RepID=A0AAE3KST2_9BACT|nr:phosphatase [Lacihabitans soyangensis]MCP9763418.1 phosphatase [Lacihabitans soyangensis]